MEKRKVEGKVNGKVYKDLRKKKTLLGLALSICQGTSELNKCAREVNECKSGMNGAFKRYLYERERERRAGKFPPEFQWNP